MKTNWVIKKLGDIVESKTGFWGPESVDGIKILRSTNFLNNGSINLNNVAVRDRLKVDFLVVGDILLEKSGGSPKQPVGRVVYFNNEERKYSWGSFIQLLRPIDIDSKYLFYYLFFSYISGGVEHYQTQTTGIRNLNLKSYLNQEIPVPPLEIQKKIVERLDTIKKAQELNDLQICKTEELFRSTLSSEISDNKQWPVKKLGEVVKFLDSKREPVTKKDRKPGPYPYYGANGKKDSVADYIFDEELVLLAEDGGNFGSKDRPVAYRVSGKCWVNNHAHVLQPKSEIKVDYLGYQLMFYDVTPYITGSTRAKLNKSDSQKITLIIPPLPEQQKIIEKLSAVQNYKKLLLKQKELLKELFDSVLHKSMSGEMD